MELSEGLKKKVGQSIRLLQSVKTDGPIEVCYSGGKDSDVILELAKMAGINYRAIYKNTTIDPPGTIKHCKEKGVEILQPKKTFFQIVEEAGWPSRWRRFCCGYLKEYKVLDYSIQGIRRCESSKRRERYKEPIVCHLYNNKERAEIVYPILNWSNDNVVEFVNKMSIKCHPLYYDENGNFHVERRLGCIGCPLQHDWGVSQFREYPNMFKAWMKAFCKWWYKPRTKPIKSQERFRDPYEATVCRLFYGGANELDSIRGHNLFETPIDCKKFLEDYFKIKLR